MGVYIKGMEMPKNCGGCPLRASCVHRIYLEYRPDYCPLIGIPPHGRLIDADAIEKKSDLTIANMADWESIVDAVNNIINCWELIKNAPTIIPAEEGE